MSGPDRNISERDYPRDRDTYRGNLPGEDIRHNSYHWTDDQGEKHRESYDYDEHGNMENLHHDNEPGPWNR